ncbi:MAG: hypothetical protein ACWGQW_08235 [bacterium]
MMGLKGTNTKAEVEGIRPEILIAWIVAGSVYQAFNVDCIMTEGTGNHVTGLHPQGLAIDLRIRQFSSRAQAQMAYTKIKDLLGPLYDCVLESDHMHIEYDPK